MVARSLLILMFILASVNSAVATVDNLSLHELDDLITRIEDRIDITETDVQPQPTSDLVPTVSPDSNIACFGHPTMPFETVDALNAYITSIAQSTRSVQTMLDGVRELGSALDDTGCQVAAPILTTASTMLNNADPGQLPIIGALLLQCRHAALEGAQTFDPAATSAVAFNAYSGFLAAQQVLADRQKSCAP